MMFFIRRIYLYKSTGRVYDLTQGRFPVRL
jgi:hypothetical protein